MKEKDIENNIKAYVKVKGWICKKIQSGAIMKSYKNKAWITRHNKINLEEKGTTDLVADFRGRCVWIEVKKDEKEYLDWLKLEERFELEKTLPAYLERELFQILEKKEILKNGWNHILTYWLKDFIPKFENFIKN